MNGVCVCVYVNVHCEVCVVRLSECVFVCVVECVCGFYVVRFFRHMHVVCY